MMLTHKITDLPNLDKIEFYYNGEKLCSTFMRKALLDLIMAFGLKDCHSMMRDAISYEVKSLFNRELSKEDKSLIIGLVNDINDNKGNRS